jgi:hypothetical protein
MTASDAASLGSFVVSVATLVAMVFGVVARLSKAEVKIETMWDIHMRNAVMSAVNKGAATLNSPLTIEVDAQGWCDSMKDDLQAFYASLPKPISDRDLILKICTKFANRMLHEVCMPNGAMEGVCLLVAASVAKNDPVITLPELDVKR